MTKHNCKTCKGRGKVQSGYAGEELVDCPDCTPCKECDGTGVVDSGGISPCGAWITLPCPVCSGTGKELYALAAIGAAWVKDSSLEKWFPIAAEELSKCTNKIIELSAVNAMLQNNNNSLKQALIGLVGGETQAELKAMKSVLIGICDSQPDVGKAVHAINVLLETGVQQMPGYE